MIQKAWFRFYEELNDFLLPERKKQEFGYCFQGNPSIKDAIEAIGVPHVEVDLILVNGQSVNFSYLLQNNDHVSVYPLFESLDITPVIHCHPEPLRRVRFVLDVHLGTLARYLRLLGFDTQYNNQYRDSRIIQIAQQENRIILTRDRGLLKNKLVTHGYWLRNILPKRQVAEVLQRFDLNNAIKPLIRCLVCNGFIHSVAKEQVMDRLPPKTQIFYNEFYQCEHCQKVYWRGAHFQKILNLIDELIRVE